MTINSEMKDKTNDSAKSKRRRARVEFIKTIIVILLFISMVTLATAVILQTQQFIISPPVDVNIDSLIILHDNKTQESIASYILPEFMGYKVNGISRGLYGSESKMRELYGLLYGGMTALLGGQSECRTLSGEEGGAEWLNCFRGDYVYVRYFTELPSSVLYYAASDKFDSQISPDDGGNDSLAEGVIPYIRELFLVPVSNSYKIVARSGNTLDQNAEIYVFNLKKDADAPNFDINTLSAYNNDSGQLADFSFLNGEVYVDGQKKPSPANTGGLERLYRLPDTTVLTDASYTQKYIAVNTGEKLAGRIYNDINKNKLLDLLGFNMNRVNTYPTEKHTVYVDEENNSRLMLSDSGALEYIGAPSGNGGKKSSGVAVSSFLGYENYGGNYTFHELTAAAASLLGSLKKIALGLMGGDAKPGLISVSGGETELELVFAYFYDNYRITGLDATVKMKFSGGKLTALELVPAEITVGKLCVSIPQRWAAARLYADLSRDEKSDEEVLTAEFVPVYKYVSNSKIAPVWAILTDGQKAGNPAD